MTDQAQNLRRKMASPSTINDAKTIAIVSGKGGVGKSNIALNLSIELTSRNKRVILFDLDVGMGNINILLGLQPKNTIVDLFNEQLTIFDIIEDGPNNLSYIAGGSGLTEFIQMNHERREYFFAQYHQLVKMYDYIIFDMGAGVTKDSLFFVLASDECMVVTTGEPTSITDAYSMIKQLIVHGGDMPIHVVLNRASSNKEMQVLKNLKKVVHDFLHVDIHPLGMIPEDKTIKEAVTRQIPFLTLNKKSPASKSVQQLADKFLLDIKQDPIIYQSSFLHKFKKLLRGNR